MKTFINGQQSNSTFFAQIFSEKYSQSSYNHAVAARHGRICRAFFLAAILLAVFMSPVCTCAAFGSTPSAPKDSYSFSVRIDLSCALGTDGEFSKVSLWVGKPGFGGCDDNLSISGDLSTITYTLTSPGSSLPRNVQVATISVTDPDCGGTRNFVVTTDGLGTGLIIDGF
jgi:hypothetical protein